MVIQTQSECFTIRRVASIEELKDTFDILGRQFTPPLSRENRLIEPLLRDYPRDRGTMLVAEKAGRIVGGVLGSGGIVRIIALEPEVRGIGLGRRLLQTFEVAAMRQGVPIISLGAAEAERGFYRRLGYRGKHSMHKELPLPGRFLELHLSRLEARLGDLERGQVVAVDQTGKIPALF